MSEDPVFDQEQRHLSSVYVTLQKLQHNLVRKMEMTLGQAAADKQSMSEELAPNLATDDDAMETYADFAAINRIVEGYNLSQEADAEQLAQLHMLLQQPYFAKVVLQFKPDQPPKELYLGAAGASDESCRRLVVDWRSPVAEVYYNQDLGSTSYQADGRTIHADLKLRRQFDIEGNRLNAYFDTSVAIQDSLLLASLSKQRSAQMQAITATIQKEQNKVVRHEDVPVLLVSGIAGSGKTSVLLQRIAYLFYQQRGSLDPSEVYLVTPNPVFRHYIENVLPDLGERNPEILTWDEFVRPLLPTEGVSGARDVSLQTLTRIDHATASFEFEANDFRDIRIGGTRLITSDQIRKLSAKYDHIPAGPHRVALIREQLLARVNSRLSQMASTESTQDEMLALDINEQFLLFNGPYDPQDEREARTMALAYLRNRFAEAYAVVERDDWLRIDRIGMRLLEAKGLAPLAWIYLKMVLTGLGNATAKYVMIDEIQDYTAAQLAVLARYFRRAHFLLLGDPHQAILEDTASFSDVRDVFEADGKCVQECQLMTSYRSTPQITELFASLLDNADRLHISSIQRSDSAPLIRACPNEQTYVIELRRAVEQARGNEGLTAIIVPWKHEAKRLRELLGADTPVLVEESATLPGSGVALLTLKLAKGLEFDHVIVPDASVRVFPDQPLARRRLYTTISRATRQLTILANGGLTPLLQT